MCFECEYGSSSGIKAYVNALRYWLDKVTGLDGIRYANFCRVMALDEESQRALDAEARNALKSFPRHSWRFALFMRRRIEHYEAVK